MNEQMVLLRNALDKMGIAWRDATGACAGFGPICAGFGTICRAHWESNGHAFSAIHVFVSYGYEIWLLDLMIDDDETIGCLSAINVIDVMEGR